MPAPLDPGDYIDDFLHRKAAVNDHISRDDLYTALVELRRSLLAEKVRNCFRPKGIRFVERSIRYLETAGKSIVDQSDKKPEPDDRHAHNEKARRMRDLYPE